MDVSEKNRKILWARSGNRCAICKQELIVNSTPIDDESIIGEECHIVSRSSGGPRNVLNFPIEKFDAYDNLILLCRIHHKMIDDQSDTYTIDILRQTKSDHEAWVKQKLSTDPKANKVTVRRKKQNIPTHLIRLTTGEEIVNLVANSCVLYTNNDHLEIQEHVESISKFFQEVQDLLDLAADFGPSYQTEIAFSLSELLKTMEAFGFWVFGAREMQVLESETGEQSNWPIAYLHVLRSDNAAIKEAKTN